MVLWSCGPVVLIRVRREPHPPGRKEVGCRGGFSLLERRPWNAHTTPGSVPIFAFMRPAVRRATRTPLTRMSGSLPCRVAIVSDIHYAGADEVARRDHLFAAISNPL